MVGRVCPGTALSLRTHPMCRYGISAARGCELREHACRSAPWQVVRRYWEFIPWIRRPVWAWAPGEAGDGPIGAVARTTLGAVPESDARPNGLRAWPFRVHRVVLPGEAPLTSGPALAQSPGKSLDVTA